MMIFICGQSFISGGEHVLKSTLRNLKTPDLKYVICKDDEQIKYFFAVEGVDVLPFKYFYSLSELRSRFSFLAYPLKLVYLVFFGLFLIHKIVTLKPKIIVSNNFSELPFSLLSRLLKVPFIQYVHEIVLPNGKVFRTIRMFQTYVNVFICVSKASQASVRSLLSQDRTALLNNSTDLYPEILPKKIELPPLKLAFVGMLNANKNPMRFLKWVQLLGASRPVTAALVYHIYDAEVLAEAERYCQENKLTVSWIKQAPPSAIKQIIRDSDFICITSVKEAFPLVALEAVSLGTPIITSDNGGVPEIIMQGKTGFVILKDEDIEKSLTPYLNPESYLELSQHCLERAQDFSHEKHAEQFAKIINFLK